MHWNELARLEAAGGAVLRKYEQLTEQAHGAQPGTSAALAKLAFEQDWQVDPAAVIAICEEAEKPQEAPKSKRKPKAEPEPEVEEDDHEEAV
jgi:hypothetical protein